MYRVRLFLAVSAVVAALLTPLAGAWVVARRDEARAHAARERVADRAAARLASLMQVHIDTVAGLQGLFDASEDLTASEFGAYGRRVVGSDGVAALAFYTRVPSAHRSEWERAIGQRISDAQGRPRGRAEEYHSLTFVARPAWRKGSHMPIGFDAISSVRRASALRAAVSLGTVQVTTPIRLVSDHRPGLGIYAPVVRGVGGRRVVVGVVASMVDGEMLNSRVAGEMPPGSRVQVTDGATNVVGDAGSGPLTERRIAVGGRVGPPRVGRPLAGGLRPVVDRPGGHPHVPAGRGGGAAHRAR